MSAVDAYVALGSNLADPVQQIQRAFVEFTQIPDTQLIACSSLYRSPPLDDSDQPDFINAVIHINTSLSPQNLLIELFNIEAKHNRERKIYWGPRTLDCDLLLYGKQLIETATLTVPHPQMRKRAFVLTPLYEIAPTLQLPDKEFLKDVLLSTGQLVKLAE